MSVRIGSHRIGSEAIAGTSTYGWPTVAITAPGAEFATAPTVTWTYGSVAGYTQTKRRGRVLNQDGTVVLIDETSDTASTSWAPVYAWAVYSTYTFEVSAFDGFNWSNLSTVVSTFTGGTTAPDPNRSVGSIYEVGINGVGYMLRDHPDGQWKYERRSASIETPRLATGNTPFSEGFDRYVMIGQSDWSSGSGQRFRDRERSDPNAYWRSEGVDPFEVGEVRLLPATSQFLTSAYTPLHATVAGSDLYVTTASGQLTRFNPGTTAFTITGCGTILDVTSDGNTWYVCDGANAYRGSTAADPGVAWSTLDAKVIEWCGDRIVIAYPSSGTAPNVVAVLDDAGVEVGAPQKWTLPVGTTVHSITSGNGYIWWSASRSSSSFIYGWKIGSTDSFFTALDMSSGSVAQGIAYYQGIVYIQAAVDDGTTAIYRGAVTSDGLLAPSLLLSIPTTSTVPMSFVGDGDKVLFTWTAMESNETGVGAIDLASGGWAKWLVNPTGDTGVARSVVVWDGNATFTIDGWGGAVETTALRSPGQLDMSVADLGTGLRKRLDTITMITDPLPPGGSVEIQVSLDGGLSYVVVGTSDVDGSTSVTFPLGFQADSASFRLILTGTLASPVVRSISAKAHPIGQADRLLVLPINCGDQVVGLNSRPLRENGKGKGADRARQLESLMQQTVYVQDIDWRATGVVSAYEVVAVEINSVGMFDRAVNRQTQDMTAVVTLRGQL